MSFFFFYFMQVAFIGVVNTLDPSIESPEDIAEALITASKYIPLDQLGATDDCGMFTLYSQFFWLTCIQDSLRFQ